MHRIGTELLKIHLEKNCTSCMKGMERILEQEIVKENCFSRSDFKGGFDHHVCEDNLCKCGCDFCASLSHEEREKRKNAYAKRDNFGAPSDLEVTKEDAMSSFNAVLLKSPKEILAFLFCTPPDKLFHEMSNDEKQDFLHFYQEVEKKSRILSQSAQIAYQQFEKDIASDEKDRLRARDKEYKVKPLEVKIKVSADDKLKSAIMKDLEKMGLGPDEIIDILRKKGM